jgi:hypothetical protein
VTTIKIEYGMIENGRGKNYGYLPYIAENGHVECNTWQSQGMSLEDAAVEAEAMAKYRASKFVGDWDIRLEFVGLVTL